MRLDEFIESHTDEIADDWQAFASKLDPSIEGMSAIALRDHILELLTSIVADMRSRQSLDEQAEKSQGEGGEQIMTQASKIHADLRIEDGFKIKEIVAEYRALRANVLAGWSKSSGGDLGDVTRFNEAIDEAIAEGIDRFALSVEATKEQFLAILGHDLRNPLGAIAMSVELMEESNKLDTDNNQYAMIIRTSAIRMTKLIDDLLDFTRSSLGGRMPLNPVPTDLEEVCMSVIKELQVLHTDRVLHFKAEGNLRGEWDGERLAQLVSNLAGNALQHGAPKYDIDIKARDDGDIVVLEVHNSGRPIPPGAITKIFDPMFRSSVTFHRSNSLGLGLYIAREIVTAHCGTIEVTSNETEGTTFFVRLPHRRHPNLEANPTLS